MQGQQRFGIVWTGALLSTKLLERVCIVFILAISWGRAVNLRNASHPYSSRSFDWKLRHDKQPFWSHNLVAQKVPGQLVPYSFPLHLLCSSPLQPRFLILPFLFWPFLFLFPIVTSLHSVAASSAPIILQTCMVPVAWNYKPKLAKQCCEEQKQWYDTEGPVGTLSLKQRQGKGSGGC